MRVVMFDPHSAGDIALVRQTNMQHERDDYNEGGDVSEFSQPVWSAACVPTVP